MTYAELVAEIKRFTENYEDDFVLSIPTFVKQAEQRIYNTVLFAALRKNVTGVFTANSAYLNCPDDFLAVSSIAVVSGGAHDILMQKDESFIRSAYPSPTATGTPRYYAMFGPRSNNEKELTLLIGPTPDSAYAVELHYYFYPESIVTASTSWVGDNFDSLLLYGALTEAYIFMKGEQDVLAMYDNKFKEALALAKKLGEGLERTDSYRTGMPRAPIT
jgi:hypothetical protein